MKNTFKATFIKGSDNFASLMELLKACEESNLASNTNKEKGTISIRSIQQVVEMSDVDESGEKRTGINAVRVAVADIDENTKHTFASGCELRTKVQANTYMFENSDSTVRIEFALISDNVHVKVNIDGAVESLNCGDVFKALKDCENTLNVA